MCSCIIIEGDMLDFNCDYIVQLCNCIAVQPSGLLIDVKIKTKLGVCPYSTRECRFNSGNLAVVQDQPMLGSIEIIQSPVRQDVKVICCFAQYAAGSLKKKTVYNINETYLTRKLAFEACLEEIYNKIPDTASIAFPYLIGCETTGNRWNEYLQMIKDYANTKKGVGNVLIVKP